jgi:glycosyltransferase involved in cell wall biosynthesis
MHIAIAEPQATGHRMRYVGNLAYAADQRGHQVTVVTTTESVKSPAFRQFVDTKLHSNTFVPLVADVFNRSTGLALAQFNARRWFSEAISELATHRQVDVVLVPYFNYIDKAVALLGSPFGNVPWSGIVMRESFHHVRLGLRPDDNASTFFKEKLFGRLLANSKLVTMITIDETLQEYGKSRFKYASRLSYAPDPSDVMPTIDRVLACAQLNLRPEDFHLLCYGHIDGRKGIVELLRAAIDQVPSNLKLLIAGKCQPAMLQEIQQFSQTHTHPQVVLLNQFVDSSMEQKLFSAADAVWVGYKDHFGSSGLLGQAAAASKPVIACEVGLIGYLTKRHQLGVAVDVGNPGAVRQAIQNLMFDVELRSRCAQAGHAFSSQRTVTHFANAILDRLEIKTKSAH